MKLPSIRCTCPDCGTIHICAHDEKKVAGWVIKPTRYGFMRRRIGFKSSKQLALILIWDEDWQPNATGIFDVTYARVVFDSSRCRWIRF